MMDNTLSIILVIFSSSIACTTGASGLREGDYDNEEDKPKEKPYYFCDLPQRIEDKICASDKLPTLAESMEAADMAFYATVLEKYKDSHTDFSMAYDALVQVHCILKGEKRVLPIINITRAGWVGGRCFLGRVAVGETYVFFVHVYKEEVYCLSDNTLLANDKLLRDLSEVNHTTMLYPIGVHEQMNLQHRCPKTVVPLPERYREENEETFNSVEQSRPHEKRSSGNNTQTQVPAIILVLFLSVIFFYL